MNSKLSTTDYSRSPEAALAAVQTLPGFREVIAAARDAQVALDERQAAEAESELQRVSAEIDTLEQTSAAERTAAEARVTAVLEELAVAREAACRAHNDYLSRRGPLVEAQRNARREAFQVRERIAAARGERRHMTEVELQAIKAPEAPPLFDPSRPAPTPPSGFIQSWQH